MFIEREAHDTVYLYELSLRRPIGPAAAAAVAAGVASATTASGPLSLLEFSTSS